MMRKQVQYAAPSRPLSLRPVRRRQAHVRLEPQPFEVLQNRSEEEWLNWKILQASSVRLRIPLQLWSRGQPPRNSKCSSTRILRVNSQVGWSRSRWRSTNGTSCEATIHTSTGSPGYSAAHSGRSRASRTAIASPRGCATRPQRRPGAAGFSIKHVRDLGDGMQGRMSHAGNTFTL